MQILQVLGVLLAMAVVSGLVVGLPVYLVTRRWTRRDRRSPARFEPDPSSHHRATAGHRSS